MQMSYSDRDTDWDQSAKGNIWRRHNGHVLVVGPKKNGGFWAMVDQVFLKGFFDTEEEAMEALDRYIEEKYKFGY